MKKKEKHISNAAPLMSFSRNKRYWQTRLFTSLCLLAVVIGLNEKIVAQPQSDSDARTSQNYALSSQPFLLQFVEWSSILDFLGLDDYVGNPTSQSNKFNDADKKRSRPTSPGTDDDPVNGQLFIPEELDSPLAAPCTFNTNAPIAVSSGGSIQAAINAADPSGGDTITIAAGTYTEQISINKCVRIIGAGVGQTIIQAPNPLVPSLIPGVSGVASIVEVRSNAYVDMSQLTVKGPVTFANLNEYGIFVAENGTLKFTNGRVTEIQQASGTNGVQNGRAVYVGRTAANQIGSIDFNNVTIDNFNKSGIFVDRTGSNAIVNSSTITGIGATGLIAQNGVTIINGASATINNSTITGHSFTGSSAASCAILAIGDRGLSVSGNTLSNNDIGVSRSLTSTLFATSILSNRIENNIDAGISLNYNTLPASLTHDVHFNYIVGNGSGLENLSTNVPINAENNFWGCNEGPGQIGCDVASGGGTTDFNPWLRLTGISATPTSISTVGGTSSISGVNLRVNSDNVNTFTDAPTAGQSVPDGIPVTYSVDNFGTLSTTSTTLVDGAAVDGTIFTAGGPFSGDKTATVRAQVANAVNSVEITVEDNTAPTVTVEQAAGQIDPTTNTPINFTVTFSEDVSGNGNDFSASDVSTAGSTATIPPANIIVTETAPNDGTTYNVSVTPTTSGAVVVSVGANSAFDPAGNGNAASPSNDNSVAFFTGAIELVVDEAGINCLPNGSPVYTTIQAAVAAASPGNIIKVCPGTYPTTNTETAIALGGLTIENALPAKPVIAVGGASYIFRVATSNVTIRGLDIRKVDATAQIVITVQGTNFTAQNNDFTAAQNWQLTGVTRAFEISGSATGLLIDGNTITDFRQPAYINGNGNLLGTISNNTATRTKGWVIDGAALTLTNNTFGQTCQACDTDFALLPNSPSNTSYQSFYSPATVLSISQNNDNAHVDVQFTAANDSGRAVSYVNAATGSASNDGRINTPYASIQQAIFLATPNSVVSDTLPGGIVNVAAGNYAETLTVDRALTILGAQAGNLAKPRNNPAVESTIVVGYSTTSPVNLQADNITFNGFAFDINQTNPTQNSTDKPGAIIVGNGNPGPGGDGYQNIRILYNRFPYNEGNADIPSLDRQGVFLFYPTNLLVEGNYFAGFPGQAVIVANGSSNFTYRNNDSYNNTNSNVGTQGNFGGPTVTLDHTNVLIENNRSDQDSMILFLIKNATIRNNTLTAGPLGSSRVYIGGGSDNVSVQNNNFALTNNVGFISFDPGFGYGPNSNINFTGNTLTRPAGATTTGSAAAIDYRGTGGTNTVSNNTVTISGSLPVNNSTYGIRIRGSASGNFTISNNTLDGGNVTASGTALPRTAGIYITSDQPVPSPQTNPATPASVTGQIPSTSSFNINCNTLTRFQEGVTVYDAVNNTSGGLQPGTSVVINNNNIVGNSLFGVNNGGTSASINGQSNYWGAADGPGPVGPGSGDKVSENVDFSSFLPAPTSCAPVAPPPTVTINQASGQDDPTNDSPINFTVVFSEPVTGFTTGDVVLSGTGNPTTAIVSEIAPNDGTTYNVAVSGMTDGTVIATIPAGVATGTNGANVASTSNDNTVTYDVTAPTATLTYSGPDPTNTALNFSVAFNESVSGLLASEISVTNGTVNSGSLTCSGNPTTCTFSVTANSNGPVVVQIPANSAQDAAGNGNAISNSISVTFDGTIPTVAVTGMGNPAPDTTSPVEFSVVFSEPVTGFDVADVTVTGTAFTTGTPIVSVTGGGANYTISVTGMNQSGTVVATVAASAAIDAAGNPNSNSSSDTVQFSLQNTLVLVSPVNMQNWAFLTENTVGGQSGQLITGPATPPLPNGSAQLLLTAGNQGMTLQKLDNTYFGTKLSELTTYSYSSYQNTPSNPQATIALQFALDENVTDSNNVFQGRLVYEPTYDQNNSVQQNQWQTWNLLSPTARFWASPNANSTIDTACPQSAPCTIAQILALYPNIGFHPTQGVVIFKVGSGVATFNGNVDNLVIGKNSVNTTYNFEPAPPTVSVSDADAVVEGNAGTVTATFTVSLDVVSTLETRVQVSTADGTATVADNDYVAKTQTVIIPAGQTSAPFTVSVNGDLIYELDETFSVNLSNAANAAIGDGSGSGTITNDEPLPTVTIVNTTTGAEPNTPNTFTVTLSGQSDSTVTVNYATTDGTATAGSDYAATNGTITFAPNALLTQTISVPTLDDTAVESTENFTLSLSNASGASIPATPATGGSATGAIADNDSTVQFATASYSSSDNAANTVTVTVTRTGILTEPAAVNYATGGGTATGNSNCTPGTDYISTSGILNFASGVSSQTFNVSVCSDSIIEGNETVNLTLSSPNPASSVTLGTPSTAVLTISDGSGGGLSISGVITQNGGGLSGVTVTLNGTSTGTLTTTTNTSGNYSFSGLLAGGDYLITPSLGGFVFEPINRSYANLQASITDANFTAYPNNNIPRKLTIGNAITAPGNPVNVPITLTSLGNENGISFTLDYDETKVTPTNVTCGTGAPSGCSVNFSIQTVSGNAVLVVSLDLPNGTFFIAGSRQALVVNFATTNTSPTTPSFVSPLIFRNSPTPSEISDGQNPVPAEFVNGTISFNNLEADVAPRQTGNGIITAADSSQISRFVAGLDTPQIPTNEFQRADCAPSGSGGNGFLTATDTAQANRYVAGLDAPRPVSGPISPVSPRSFDLLSGRSLVFGTEKDGTMGVNTTIKVINAFSSANGTVLITIAVDAAGNENAFGFSIGFDPTKLSLPSANPNNDVLVGSGAVDSTNTPAALTANTTQAGSGRIGILLNFGAGRSIVAGSNRQLALIRFKVAPTAVAGQPISLTFGDSPIFRETADTLAQPVSTNYVDGAINIGVPTAASTLISGRVRSASGKPISGAAVTLTDSNGNSRTAKTDLRGFYKFNEVPTGATYIIGVSDKWSSGKPQIITLTNELADLDLIF